MSVSKGALPQTEDCFGLGHKIGSPPANGRRDPRPACGGRSDTQKYLHVVGDVGRDEHAAAPFALGHVDLDKVESIAKQFSYFEQQ